MFHAREYVKATSLEEAYQLNQKRGSVLVGGMMWLKMAQLEKATVIDLSGLALDGIQEEEDGFVVGCMCTLRQLELHEGLNRSFNHVFRECAGSIVGVQFRNSATVGGSIFGRYGFSDILTCLMALDTTVELYHGGMVPLAEFARMKYDRDVLVRLHIRKDGRKPGYLSQRNSKSDFPVIACAVAKKGQEFYVAVGARPGRAQLAVVSLGTAGEIAPEGLDHAARKAVGKFAFHDNMRAGGEYRRHLAAVYVKRLMGQLIREDGQFDGAVSGGGSGSGAAVSGGQEALVLRHGVADDADHVGNASNRDHPEHVGNLANTGNQDHLTNPVNPSGQANLVNLSSSGNQRAISTPPNPAGSGFNKHMQFMLNGKMTQVEIAADTLLIDLLRGNGCYSVKRGCETANCGLCTVWLDEKPVLSCSLPAARVAGRRVTTLEGLQEEAVAFGSFLAGEGAEQCGFCSPGLIMNVLAMERELVNPDETAIKEYLSGNLCRCTGYMGQLRAVVKYLESKQAGNGKQRPCQSGEVV